MKKQLFIISSIFVLGTTSCTDTSTKMETKTDTATSAMTSPGDTTVKTTTTTTTTTTIHPIANFEHRTFLSVKTGKKIVLKVDTVHHYYIDVNTNQQPDYYYFDPSTHDTFDYKGRILNHALVYDKGNYNIDESKITDNSGGTNDAGSAAQGNSGTSTSTDNSNGTSTSTGNLKIKQKDGMYKEKTDNSKIKIKEK